MTPWHFTPQPADLPIGQFRERLDHPDMPEKFKMIRGKPFGATCTSSSGAAVPRIRRVTVLQPFIS